TSFHYSVFEILNMDSAVELTYAQRASLAAPMTITEICLLRDIFYGWRPYSRFAVEMKVEMKRINKLRRELQQKKEYVGPTVVGERGLVRCAIMARSTVRKRWEALNLWSDTW